METHIYPKRPIALRFIVMSPFSCRSVARTAMLLFAMVLLSMEARASLILEHVGATDPATEGWDGSGGVGINDGGELTLQLSGGRYTQSAATLPVGSRWTLSTRMKMRDNSVAPGPLSHSIYADGSTLWELNFGTEADGDPIVKWWNTGLTYTLQGGAGAYHDYDVVFDGSTADLFVDNVEVVSDFSGVTLGFSGLSFGNGGGGGSVNSNYSLVRFTTQPVPEPSSFIVWAVGALFAMALYGWRRRRCSI